MDAYTRTLRFNHNPLNLILGAEKKKGLRIGYMEAGLQGFYLNSIETGIHPQKLSKLLTEEFHCTDNESATGLFQRPGVSRDHVFAIRSDEHGPPAVASVSGT